MVWDDDKSTGDDLTADEWDAHVTDQKGHVTRHEVDGPDELDATGLSGVGDSWSVNSITDADSPYSASDNELIIADASGASITINAPTPNSDVRFAVVASDTTNTITISRNGTEDINGSASDHDITHSPTMLAFIADGTNWWYDAQSGVDAPETIHLPIGTRQDPAIEFKEEGNDQIGIRPEGAGGGDSIIELLWKNSKSFEIDLGFHSIEDAAGDKLELKTQGPSGASVRLSQSSTFNVKNNPIDNIDHARYNPQDVRNISSPAQGYVAYHDGSGTNTEGLAGYDGTNWISQVDGSTVS